MLLQGVDALGYIKPSFVLNDMFPVLSARENTYTIVFKCR